MVMLERKHFHAEATSTQRNFLMVKKWPNKLQWHMSIFIWKEWHFYLERMTKMQGEDWLGWTGFAHPNLEKDTFNVIKSNYSFIQMCLLSKWISYGVLVSPARIFRVRKKKCLLWFFSNVLICCLEELLRKGHCSYVFFSRKGKWYSIFLNKLYWK